MKLQLATLASPPPPPPNLAGGGGGASMESHAKIEFIASFRE